MILLTFFLCALCVLCGASGAAEVEQKPYFTVILADDLGDGDLACYGAKDVATLHLDRMAREGVKFTSFDVAPVCSPTRASFMTGAIAQRVGIGGVLFPRNNHGLNPEGKTLPELLKAQGCGHTYGHHSIWQMHSPKHPGVAGPKEFWYDALDAPSARQMGHLRKLVESRPFLTQGPDLSLLAFEQTAPWDMCLSLRGGGYALLYTPTGRTLDVQLGTLPGARIRASWFDPRTGQSTRFGEFDNQGRRAFDPPGKEAPGNDWVLVLDQAD
jgi:hypothetical protein